jgi:hypothetical protein
LSSFLYTQVNTLFLAPATKQPSNQATKQPSNQATKQPSNQATKQPSNQATKQPTRLQITIAPMTVECSLDCWPVGLLLLLLLYQLLLRSTDTAGQAAAMMP